MEDYNCITNKEPIRVLCVFSSLDRGGAESMCMNLYRHIDRSRVQFDFVKHIDKHCAFEEEIESLGGAIHRAPTYKGYNHLEYCHWWNTFLQDHPEYSIVHAHTFTLADIYLHIAQMQGRITISHSHSTGVRGSGVSAVIKTFMSLRAGNHADYRFACSYEAGKWMYRSDRFIVLKNAIDCDKYKYSAEIRNRLRKEMELEDSFVIGTVGSMMEVKNPYGILSIISKLHEKRKDTKFVWVGSGPMLNEIKTIINEQGLEDCICLLGKRNDVCDLLQVMDAFILPSLHEGLPVSAIEAQVSGLPCLISDRVTREVDVTHNCRFLPIESIEKWVEELLNLEINRTDMSEIVKAAGYDINITAKEIQDFYLSISNETNR